jgi:hypothetical protein
MTIGEREIKMRIEDELARVEREQGVRVLYACESGSRAWGFASEDSDYDVRFIYAHRLSWYLSVEDRRDVIEKPITDDLDVSGWELRKALQLLRKSNPALLEWLRSPTVYRKHESFFHRMEKLATAYFDARHCFWHYFHHAASTRKKYLAGEQISRKKYLYALRPLLACRWLEQGLGPVPMEFETLLGTVVEDRGMAREMEALLDAKRRGFEQGHGERLPVLDIFIDGELARLELVKFDQRSHPSTEALNAFLAEWIEGA